MKLTLENEYYTVTIEEKPDGWKPDDYSELRAWFDMFKNGMMGLGFQQYTVERGFEAQAEESITKESE